MRMIPIILLAFAVTATAATIEERQAELVATGDFISVGDPVRLTKGSQIDRSGNKWGMVVTWALASDSSVVNHRTIYVWVESPDSVYWDNGYNPTVTPAISFVESVKFFMATREPQIDGHVISAGVTGDTEWALVTRYVTGDDNTKLKTQTVRIIRSDSGWSFKILE